MTVLPSSSVDRRRHDGRLASANLEHMSPSPSRHETSSMRSRETASPVVSRHVSQSSSEAQRPSVEAAEAREAQTVPASSCHEVTHSCQLRSSARPIIERLMRLRKRPTSGRRSYFVRMDDTYPRTRYPRTVRGYMSSHVMHRSRPTRTRSSAWPRRDRRRHWRDWHDRVEPTVVIVRRSGHGRSCHAPRGRPGFERGSLISFHTSRFDLPRLADDASAQAHRPSLLFASGGLQIPTRKQHGCLTGRQGRRGRLRHWFRIRQANMPRG